MKLSALTLLAAITDGKKNHLKRVYNVTDAQLDVIDASDPTNNGTYAEWLTRAWVRDNLLHLPEDQTLVRAYLGKFNRVKGKTEWSGRGHSKDILSYQTPQALLQALETIQDVVEKAPGELPPVSDQSPIMYQDETYTMWKVNNVADAKLLSQLPATWCTKQDQYAQRYTSDGSLYPCFKNGEAFFQYHPGGPQSGAPQFMNKFNATMQSVKIMNEEAYNVIKKAAELHPENKDLANVVDNFSAPNLSDAETLAYLMDVLKTNPDFAKGNKEFQDLENKFVGQRYKIFDLTELSGLLNRYPRAGEVVSKMVNDNNFVKGLMEKVEGFESFDAFAAATKKRDASGITEEEGNIIAQIPAVFSKVFALFSKSNDFDAKVAELKTKIKSKDAEALVFGKALINLIKSKFVNSSYGYGDGTWRSALGYKASERFQGYIAEMMRPLMSDMLKTIEANKDLTLAELIRDLNSAIYKIKQTNEYDEKLSEWCSRRKTEILTNAVTVALEAIQDDSIASLVSSFAPFYSVRIPTEVSRVVTEKRKAMIDPKITAAFSEISADLPFEEKVKACSKIQAETTTLPSSFNNLVDSLVEGCLTEDIKLKLAEVNKLKQVSEAIEDLPIPNYSWLTRLGEDRKAEIRQANEDRLRARQDGIEGGTVRTRYAPKQEIENWRQTYRQQRYNSEEEKAAHPLQPLSEKGEKFLETSPSYELSEVTEYYVAMKKSSPTLEAKLLDEQAWSQLLDYEVNVKRNAPWPELEAKLLKAGYNNQWTTKYKEEVYPNSEWPGFEEGFLTSSAADTNSNYCVRNLVDFNTRIRGGKKWDELEKRVAQSFTTEHGKYNLSYSHRRDDYVINPMLTYVKGSKQRLNADLEKTLCEYEEFAMPYMMALIPREKVFALLNKFEEDELAASGVKTSSHHFNLFAVLMNELEKI